MEGNRLINYGYLSYLQQRKLESDNKNHNDALMHPLFKYLIVYKINSTQMLGRKFCQNICLLLLS